MNNELVNEINNARGSRLFNTAGNRITVLVKNAVDILAPGANNALAGLDAEDDGDGITERLWKQAVQAAEMDGSLTFPQYRNTGDTIPPDAEPVSFEIAQNVIAGRVARAILIVNGMVTGFGHDPACEPLEDWHQA